MHKAHKKKRSSRKARNGSVSSQSVASSGDITSDAESEASSNACISCKGALKPYELRTSDIMGRYLVASRDLAAGTLLMSEVPLAIGPCAGVEISCLGCYKPMTSPLSVKQYKCPRCGWPLCGPLCPGQGTPLGHSPAECDVLRDSHSSRGLDYSDDVVMKDNYEAIMPLRCLLLRRTSPAQYRVMETMESHNLIRRSIPSVWGHNERTVVHRIRNTWGLHEHDEDEIHTVCGVLEVNAFEVGHDGARARAIYPSAFLLAHDCTPNTTHTDVPRTYRLTIRAAVPIAQGDAMTLSYANTLQGTILRREQLLESKFFLCNCKRCSDPTELGTYISALKCPKCTNGLVLQNNSIESDSNWNCNKCKKYTVTSKHMNMLTDRINEELERIDCNDVIAFESFLSCYRNVLHPNHYLCLSAKHSLSQLYGKIDGFLIQELDENTLSRKHDICEDIMKVFDVLEPGLTRLRGITLYEMHAPVMIQTTRDYEAKRITTDELRERLKRVTSCLRQANAILSLEPKDSSEGMMAAASQDALRRIKDWQKIIGKI